MICDREHLRLYDMCNILTAQGPAPVMKMTILNAVGLHICWCQ